MEYWKAVYKDANGRETYYVPDDLDQAKNLCDGIFESTPLSFNLDE